MLVQSRAISGRGTTCTTGIWNVQGRMALPPYHNEPSYLPQGHPSHPSCDQFPLLRNVLSFQGTSLSAELF